MSTCGEGCDRVAVAVAVAIVPDVKQGWVRCDGIERCHCRGMISSVVSLSQGFVVVMAEPEGFDDAIVERSSE